MHLVHSIEAYTAVEHTDLQLNENKDTIFPGRKPMGKMVAAQGIQLVGQHLVTAVKQPR